MQLNQNSMIREDRFIFGLILGQKPNGFPVIKFWGETTDIRKQKWGCGFIIFSFLKPVEESNDIEEEEEDDED